MLGRSDLVSTEKVGYYNAGSQFLEDVDDDMVNPGDPPVAINLFSGAGGLSEGLLAAGIDVVVAVENHPHPALTHAFNHPGTTVLCGDIRELPLELVLKQA